MDEVIPPVTRSLLALETAAELVRTGPARAAKAIVERPDGRELVLYGSGTIAGIDAVANGTSTLAIVNPSAALTLAARGNGPFATALPLRTIAVIPTRDQCAMVVHPQTGLRTFADIAAHKPALRISVRGDRTHSLHFILDDIMRVHGFGRDDVAAWGGSFAFDLLRNPTPQAANFRALTAGAIDAIFDEGTHAWVDAALAAGMRVLPIGAAELQALEALGYRRASVAGAGTVDFSGWPLFVRSDTGDADVTAICDALAACCERIPWQEPAPLTLARMCANAPDAPYDVPLHPAAERAWRARGVL